MAEAKLGITVRRATELDYAAAIDIIEDAFDGLDYLPSSYYTYFHTGKHVVYVAEQDGLLVGRLCLALFIVLRWKYSL